MVCDLGRFWGSLPVGEPAARGPWWAVFLMAAGLVVSACSTSPREVEEYASAVDPAGSPLVHELPAIIQGEAHWIEHAFRIANGTDGPLEIARVQRSCTCAEVKLDSQRLLPGEETLFHVRADLVL